MGHADAEGVDRPAEIDPGAPETIDVPVSRRKMLTVGVPAVAVVAAVGAVPFLFGSRRDDEFVSSLADVQTTMTTTPPTTTERAILPGSTTTSTSTTSTTTAPTTTVAPTSTVAELPQPIAPPADSRAEEEFLQLGSMSIPKLDVEAPLLEGIRLTTLDLGPGHWPGSAMPGEVGNVVVAAHRTSHGGPFRHIDQLVDGDVVSFTTDGVETEYRVTGTQIVEPDALWITDPTPEPTATLFACHPPGSVAQRIVVNLELAT
ncbi:class E sortase [Ilumatobacter nonamiensis]|uniref:class E sortase n=1 Tax=Ilumatobacter nonamiensis TaxID=467093 RepID=UPI00068412E4|nr:class E sortase [Ilumatobacter nonamiensis]